jgi:hypothetical protein
MAGIYEGTMPSQFYGHHHHRRVVVKAAEATAAR